MSAVSGILLVGGASERFGSPKALARFRGESLAERAWRLLHEACNEVLAVGKESDALDLPFPVLDDGSLERAPVYGVIAGLRAASNDVCLVLPVDCPLVTAEALRALADAVAVPQTGPLPGAYAKEMLPELEARVERGELSLRGVNTNILEVDEKLFVNVNTRMDLIAAALYDELDMERALELQSPDRESLPNGAAFTELASDFWYHALWTAKKLRRGEVFTALECLDGYLKARLVTLIEWHARSVDPAVDTWHGGRFLERWADPGALAALEKAFAHYDVRDVARALWETIDLWQGLEEETASRLGLELVLDHADLRRRVAEVVPDPRPASTLWP